MVREARAGPRAPTAMDPSPKIVVAGGSGMLGRRLAAALAGRGWEVVVLTRSPAGGSQAPGIRRVGWDGRGLGGWASEIDGARAVANLAGENVGGGRWTAARKRQLAASRLEPTRALVEAVGRARERPAVLLQASAVGYYGARGETMLDEQAAPGRGFLPELCRSWEAASAEVEALGVRRVLLRTGIVLAREGGALRKMLPIFRAGLGGPLGNGRQWFSWIHAADAVAAMTWLLASAELAGAVHLTAPEPVTNEGFSSALGRALGRPTLLRVPPFALRLAVGEMAEVLLAGQRVVPRRLEASGFEFRFPKLDAALADLVRRR